MHPDLPITVTREVRDRCLCLHLQRAARAVARRFDHALQPVGLTSGQFSLLMSLNRPDPPLMQEVAHVLAMDRTTLTANLKPLVRRGLAETSPDPKDRRGRRIRLTEAGEAALKDALPIWRRTHDEIDGLFAAATPDAMRADLVSIAYAG